MTSGSKSNSNKAVEIHQAAHLSDCIVKLALFDRAPQSNRDQQTVSRWCYELKQNIAAAYKRKSHGIQCEKRWNYIEKQLTAASSGRWITLFIITHLTQMHFQNISFKYIGQWKRKAKHEIELENRSCSSPFLYDANECWTNKWTCVRNISFSFPFCLFFILCIFLFAFIQKKLNDTIQNHSMAMPFF